MQGRMTEVLVNQQFRERREIVDLGFTPPEDNDACLKKVVFRDVSVVKSVTKFVSALKVNYRPYKSVPLLKFTLQNKE